MQLLEDQLRLSVARIEAIKIQATKFKINIHFLERSEFEGITSEALAWKKFLNNQVGPSSSIFVHFCNMLQICKHSVKAKFWEAKSWGSPRVIRRQPNGLILFV